MDMLAFGKQHVHQVAVHTGLNRHVGDGYDRAQFRQDYGHGTALYHLHRNRLFLLIGGLTMSAVVLSAMRAQKCKTQYAYDRYTNACQNQLAPA
ncbi:hypothetical protein APE01nite_01480 [Acetobacter peroxydans]|uniref:Uncharacterized protein n=1 Tax=Acetobacter peroxydans TaxID=104098 RepID=A0A4Y3TMV9_9PROT|nr:hypothetical protein AA13755_0861 [Acetobacter peroxydans NBRC 13755]GBR41445.1 hypothetical protein AA0475_1118 [Acetobacter peroxydans]GEB84351.1 hypothetical protein APE01nite_01480 [Acetobacter peroxydans]